MKKVSILIPAHNEESSLDYLYVELCSLMANLPQYEWEIMLVNDGSVDGTLGKMRELHAKDPRIHYLDLSRNFGKENAMLAGLDYAQGDCTIIMDADLQDPPSLIPEMLEKWEEGYEDVYAKRKSRGKESYVKKFFSLLFYRILQQSTRIDIPENVGDFRLLDRRCVKAICSLREKERYSKGLFAWVGFKTYCLEFDRCERVAGETSWNYFSLFRLAVDGLVSFTTFPLRLATILGSISSFASIVYMIIIFVKTLIWGDPVAGYPTLICVILMLGGLQLFCIGIIGEYLARVFSESKNRPAYIVREHNGDLV